MSCFHFLIKRETVSPIIGDRLSNEIFKTDPYSAYLRLVMITLSWLYFE